MNGKYTANAGITINKPAENVWRALTDPTIIKEYFFGTETSSEWKEGSAIEFTGTWQGKKYHDKGVIQKIVPNELLQYTFLSSFSNAEDKPDNYALITYKLTQDLGSTKLLVSQDNIASEEIKNHSEQNWNSVLNNLKSLLEKQQYE